MGDTGCMSFCKIVGFQNLTVSKVLVWGFLPGLCEFSVNRVGFYVGCTGFV